MKSRQGFINNRQAIVGIRCCIAVTRKMLCTADNAVLLHTLYRGRSHISYCNGIIAVGTQSDNRIICVIININNGRKIRVYSENTQLTAHDLSCHTCIFGITCCPECHITGQSRAASQTVDRAALLVGTDDHRYSAVLSCGSLHMICQIICLFSSRKVLCKINNRTKIVVLDYLTHLAVHNRQTFLCNIVGCILIPISEIHHKHLSYLILQGHTFDNAFNRIRNEHRYPLQKYGNY